MKKRGFNSAGRVDIQKMISKQKSSQQSFFDDKFIKIIKQQNSLKNPLKCELFIELSNELDNPEKIKDIYDFAKDQFKGVPKLNFLKINDLNFKIKLESDNNDCNWCKNFTEFLDKEFDAKIHNMGSCFDKTK